MIRKLIRGGSGGFTLIELLIVIAIIALLAVAVLAAINPIEQINKSRDTGKISDASQMLSALDRYYAKDGFYPWNLVAYTGGGQPTDAYVGALPVAPVCTGTAPSTLFCELAGLPITGNGATTWLKELKDEVKSAYLTRVVKSKASGNINPLAISKAANSDSIFVCFKPQSKASREAAYKRCMSDAANLPGAGAATGACPPNATGAYVAEWFCTP